MEWLNGGRMEWWNVGIKINKISMLHSRLTTACKLKVKL